jgi:large subunit ribosomal protein L4
MPTAKKSTTTKKVSQKNLKNEVFVGTKVPVFDLSGETKSEVVFPKSIEKSADPKLIAQVYRVHRTNTRTGTQSTKTRGEVEGSSRKIYRQKGTGRARHGSIRAPIFVGGGIVFGPRPRIFSAKVSQKMRRLALMSLLSSKAAAKKLQVVAGATNTDGKTKTSAKLLRKLTGGDRSTIVVVEGQMEKFTKSLRNLKNTTIRSLNNLSASDLVEHENLVMTKESFENLVSQTKS